MEIKQEKKQEKSPGQEQKDSQLQVSNFAAGAERGGAKTSENSKGGDSQINLSQESFSGAASRENNARKASDQGGKNSHDINLANERFTGAASRESFLKEGQGKSMESKATNVPEAANKQKLKEQ